MDAVLIEFPQEIIEEIDRIAGEGNRTSFLVDMAKSQILQHRHIEAIEEATGAWRDEDCPELAAMGTNEYVRWLRSPENQRFHRLNFSKD